MLSRTVVLPLLMLSALSSGQLTASLKVAPGQSAQLTSLTLDPNVAFGGGSTSGTVALSAIAPSGGRTVSLSTNSGVVTIPTNVTVVEGANSASFEVSVGHVSQTYVRSIVASMDGVNRTAFLTIHPGLRRVSTTPSNLTGGSPSKGGVLLWGEAPAGGVTIALSDNSGSIGTPATVFVPAGSTSSTFSISTVQVGTDHLRLVSGSLNGVTKSAYLTLTAGPRLAAFAITPNALIGGQDTTGTITLTGPVAAGMSRTAQVADNSSAVITPAEVVILSNDSTRDFVIGTAPVSAMATRLVTVSQGGITRNAFITLNPS